MRGVWREGAKGQARKRGWKDNSQGTEGKKKRGREEEG